jgi:alpha-galactosidase
MQGVLGVGGNIAHWTAAELEHARRLIAQYKDIRPLVQFGRQFWLEPPKPIGPCAVQYVDPHGDATVIFEYQVRGLRGAGVRRMRLHGLRPDARYRRFSDGMESTGSALTRAGVPTGLVDPTVSKPVLDFRSAFQGWRVID